MGLLGVGSAMWICIKQGLYSVLADGKTLHFHHQSFVDFLLSSQWCPKDFLIDTASHHQKLLEYCLEAMKRGLKFNICHLKTSHLWNDDVPNLKTDIETYIPPWLSYACCNWADHLSMMSMTPDDSQVLEKITWFLHNQFLYWLEVLSLLKVISLARNALQLVVEWTEVR